MKANGPSQFAFVLYLTGFYVFLLGPLAVLVVTAFNTPAYPQVWPFEGFTLKWFAALAADRSLIAGLQNSLWIGVCVVLLSVPLGLAGAMAMTQAPPALRAPLYMVLISPVLTPGVIVGISTVIFWKDATGIFRATFLFNGFYLTVLGQSTFIASYCMLVFLSRLRRFDFALEEAALDLGATRTQVFAHILLPYLRPAIVSAAALAFLSSFENYNTTTFAILADKTLTTVLAGRVRQGVTPAISALATIILAITLLGAGLYGLASRRRPQSVAG